MVSANRSKVDDGAVRELDLEVCLARDLLTALRIDRDDRLQVRTGFDLTNRAYYAAFYAVCALFAVMEGAMFKKHQQVASAVPRELVKSGRYQQDFGEMHSKLFRYRSSGDNDVVMKVLDEDADIAVQYSEQIIRTIHEIHPQEIPMNKWYYFV